MEQSKGLDGGTLKLMAAALMLIDHVGAILLPETVILRCIGRLAFPVFAFFIAEGYAHTRSFGRYLLRMAIWAAVSEIPFNLEFGHFFVPGRQNVLWTFCLALLTLRGAGPAAQGARDYRVRRRGAGAGGRLCCRRAAACGLRRLGRDDCGAVLSVPGGQICKVRPALGHAGAERIVYQQPDSAGFRHSGAYTDFGGGGAAGDLAV